MKDCSLTKLIIRPGATADLRQAAELLSAIALAGGTTALTSPLSRDALGDWLTANPDQSAWQVAETATGDILGFQWIGPFDRLPAKACEIGTYVKTGQTGLGIGSKLFDATKAAARAMGYGWIRATIRADNTGGLAYYQSRGFEDYAVLKDIKLEDGTLVSKRCKRFDL